MAVDIFITRKIFHQIITNAKANTGTSYKEY